MNLCGAEFLLWHQVCDREVENIATGLDGVGWDTAETLSALGMLPVSNWSFFFLVQLGKLLHYFFNAKGKGWCLFYHVLSMLSCNICFISYLYIFTFCLLKSIPLDFSHFSLLTAACYPVSQFISCKTNLKCHWKMKKKRKNCCLIWSLLFRHNFPCIVIIISLTTISCLVCITCGKFDRCCSCD